MATELAMGAVFPVMEVTKALSHDARTERISKVCLGRMQPTHRLLRLSSEQPHEVLHLDELAHKRRRRVPVVVLSQCDRARTQAPAELDYD
jgi:hypothetical protein